MRAKKIEEFFYSKASKRIKTRVENSGLTHAEIYGPDSKQISRIINNKRTKNNRFLICDAVIENCGIDKKTGKFRQYGLLKTNELKFKDKKEIFWGTDSEIDSYMFDLFKLLWQELPNFKIDSEIYLYDYIPYAKYKTYYNYLFNCPSTYPALFYGIKEDTVIENLEPSKNDAFLFFYQKYEKDFSNFFHKFAEKNLSFNRFDKLISNTLLPSFIDNLESHKPDSTSLGIRVRDLIIADLSHSASMIANNNFNSYRTSLTKASSNYILALERIQQQYC